MKCPVCKETTLLMSEKNGVEIDYCPDCRGVWLDRGELEKLIQGEKRYVEENYGARAPEAPRQEYPHGQYDHKQHYDHKHHKKRSFLESFDFFD